MKHVRDLPQQLPRVPVQPPSVYIAPQWEYKHLWCSLEERSSLGDTDLNALGADGWELVSVFAESGSVHFYFKRLTR